MCRSNYRDKGVNCDASQSFKRQTLAESVWQVAYGSDWPGKAALNAKFQDVLSVLGVGAVQCSTAVHLQFFLFFFSHRPFKANKVCGSMKLGFVSLNLQRYKAIYSPVAFELCTGIFLDFSMFVTFTTP